MYFCMVNSRTNMHGSLHSPVSFQSVKLYTLSVVVHVCQDVISKIYYGRFSYLRATSYLRARSKDVYFHVYVTRNFAHAPLF